MNPPSRKKIVNTQQDLIKNDLKEHLNIEEAVHTCWACFKGLDDPKHNPQRAHIISVQNGGNNKPSNFFLLCKQCHKEQPDGNSFEMQLLWLQNQKHNITQTVFFAKEMLSLIHKEAKKQFEDSEVIIEDYVKYLGEENIKKVLSQASSKSSGLNKLNFENNLKFWFLDHFKTWIKLKKLEGKFTDPPED